MSSLRDFLQSALSDALLPAFRQTFEDVVFEALNDRKVPTRTDFLELRDLVNRLRGQASSAQNGTKKLDKRFVELEGQLAILQARCDAQQEAIEALQAALKTREKPRRAPPKKKAAPKKG